MWYIRKGVKEPEEKYTTSSKPLLAHFCSLLVDAMSTVGPDYREPIGLGVLLDLITNVTVLLTRTNCGQETKSSDKQYCSPAKYLYLELV